MGWIHARAMKTGQSLNTNPAKQRKGPLRKIICLVYPESYTGGMFERPLVELECGHRCMSDGQFKARCSKCAEPTAEPAAAPGEGVG